jgi:hypothetical protein
MSYCVVVSVLRDAKDSISFFFRYPIANYMTSHSRKKVIIGFNLLENYRGADKFLARPGRKKATATEGFDFHVSYL